MQMEKLIEEDWQNIRKLIKYCTDDLGGAIEK